MSQNILITTGSKNISLDAVLDQLNSGYLRIYDGSRPVDPNTAITSQTLLAELTFGSTAFAAASGGSKTANAITKDSSANNTGTATWFRCFKSDSTTAVLDGNVGTSAADLIMPTTSIVAAAEVSVTSLVFSYP